MIYNYHYSINLSSSLLVPKMFSHHFVYTSFFFNFHVYMYIRSFNYAQWKIKKTHQGLLLFKRIINVVSFQYRTKNKNSTLIRHSKYPYYHVENYEGPAKKKGTATIVHVPFTGLSLDFCFVTDIIIKQK